MPKYHQTSASGTPGWSVNSSWMWEGLDRKSNYKAAQVDTTEFNSHLEAHWLLADDEVASGCKGQYLGSGVDGGYPGRDSIFVLSYISELFLLSHKWNVSLCKSQPVMLFCRSFQSRRHFDFSLLTAICIWMQTLTCACLLSVFYDYYHQTSIL